MSALLSTYEDTIGEEKDRQWRYPGDHNACKTIANKILAGRDLRAHSHSLLVTILEPTIWYYVQYLMVSCEE